jgi:hypothetical protein
MADRVIGTEVGKGQTYTRPNIVLTNEIVRAIGELTLLSAHDVVKRSRPEYLVDGILPMSGIALIYGPSGTAKSFLIIDLAWCVAAGQDWFGYKTKRRPVVIIAYEGQSGICLRILAKAKATGMRYPPGMEFIFDSPSLFSNEEITRLILLIQTYAPGAVVMIDTLNRAAPGEDENSSVAMGKIIAAMSAIQAATSGLVIIVHHTGKDSGRGPRGHSSLIAAVDAAVETSLDGERLLWTLIKSKDGEDKICHAFELEKIELEEDEDGKVWSSCVVTEVERGAISSSKNEPKGTNQKILLSAFQALLLQEQMLCSSTGLNWPVGISVDEAIGQLKDNLVAVDHKHRQSRTKEALERLVEMGYLVLNENLLNLPSNQQNTKGN